jgi:hypothetical protein
LWSGKLGKNDKFFASAKSPSASPGRLCRNGQAQRDQNGSEEVVFLKIIFMLWYLTYLDS